jgi:hypothetical protein
MDGYRWHNRVRAKALAQSIEIGKLAGSRERRR